MVTFPSCSSRMSAMVLSRKMLKRVGRKRHFCLISSVVLNHSPIHKNCTYSLVIEVPNGAK